MADKNIVKQKKADRRRLRVRGKVNGTPERPRLTVRKSLNNIFAQLVDDVNRVTIVGLSTNSKAIASELNDKMTKTEKAKKVGELIAKLAKDKGIESVVFDRNTASYTGRVKAVADGAREGGLVF